MGTFGHFLVFLLCLGYCVGQEGPVTQLQPLTSRQLRELQLVHNPALLEVAARFNTRVFINFTMPMMTAIVQERVNVNMDCYGWAKNFPGGSIRWLSRNLNQGLNGLEVGDNGMWLMHYVFNI